MTTNSIQTGVSTSLLESASAAKTVRTDAAATPTATSATQNDLQISSASSALATAMSTSDVRSEKVAAIKSAIDAGTYSVSSVDVADKLIEGMLK